MLKTKTEIRKALATAISAADKYPQPTVRNELLWDALHFVSKKLGVMISESDPKTDK